MGKFMQGMTVTKTMGNNGSCKSKFEKNCASSKSKVTVECTSGLTMDKWFSISKPSFTFDNAGDKHAAQLKITPAANLNGMDNANFNFAYNFAKSTSAHHLKLAKSTNGLNFCLGLKQANVIELSASKNINKSLKTPCGCIALDLDNFHSKSTYDLNKSNWESSVAFDYNNINAFGFG